MIFCIFLKCVLTSSQTHVRVQYATTYTTGVIHNLYLGEIGEQNIGHYYNPDCVLNFMCYVDWYTRRFADPGGILMQVTNTPWGERVIFVFDPSSDLVAKPLHVSPFMVCLSNLFIYFYFGYSYVMLLLHLLSVYLSLPGLQLCAQIFVLSSLGGHTQFSLICYFVEEIRGFLMCL